MLLRDLDFNVFLIEGVILLAGFILHVLGLFEVLLGVSIRLCILLIFVEICHFVVDDIPTHHLHFRVDQLYIHLPKYFETVLADSAPE